MGDHEAGKPIIVGFDGSAGADQALQWATAESRIRGLPVRRVSIAEGSVVGALCELSRDASMMVLGARGSGGFRGQLIGSVTLSVAVHAGCPVIVIRGDHYSDVAAQQDLPIIVGMDESASAQLAAQFAVAEADLRECPLVGLHAWRVEHGARDPGELEAAQRRTLADALRAAQEGHPAVRVSLRLPIGSPGKALVEASSGAQLVVVGSRGMGGFTGLLLGSVGQQLLHHAACPVAVIR